VLSIVAFCLILPLNTLTKQMSVAAVIRRHLPLLQALLRHPQAYLGIAFGFGIPMAFAAIQNQVPPLAWLLLIGNVFWTLAYDTEYAMVDRDDDLKIGIKTSAITFGRYDVAIIMLCYRCIWRSCWCAAGSRACASGSWRAGGGGGRPSTTTP
jgi:4-hydroxybenzoate polyprenyltransferase